MTLHARDLSKWVTSHGATNRPNAVFWLGQALQSVRYARKHLERAEADTAGSSGPSLGQAEALIAELERHFPSEALAEEVEEEE
jgi:uncharacterized protein YigE (DUF2233 family)